MGVGGVFWMGANLGVVLKKSTIIKEVSMKYLDNKFSEKNHASSCWITKFYKHENYLINKNMANKNNSIDQWERNQYWNLLLTCVYMKPLTLLVLCLHSLCYLLDNVMLLYPTVNLKQFIFRRQCSFLYFWFQDSSIDILKEPLNVTNSI